GEGGIKQPERVGKVQLLEHLEAVAAARCYRRRRPLADPVHGEDGRLLEGRGKEGRGRVTLVMLGKEKPALPVVARREPRELLPQELLLEQLLAQPKRDRHAEGAEALGRKGKVGLQETLELEEGLVVEHDMVDRIERDARSPQAIGKCRAGKAGIVLLAREALLLCRRHDTA